MISLNPYLPQDRLRALSRGEELPDRTTGAALFADISGFTALTEELTYTLGPRRGIEELTRQINIVYDFLIAQVEKYGGSVISFAGDAITCWFSEIEDFGFQNAEWKNNQQLEISNQSSALRAVACAFSLQDAMHQFPNLGLKVAVTSGSARRFAVGNPDIQWVDTLAGKTINRLATAEQLISRGEIIVDESTHRALVRSVQVGEWRKEGKERFAVLEALNQNVLSGSWLVLEREIPSDELRPWIIPTVFERERNQGLFLTELRPVTAFFLRFSGIDYEAIEAENQLSRLIRRVQTVFQRYDGTMLQLTIGDKGSYLYGTFGAPVAHEDDTRRAVKTALNLQTTLAEFEYLSPVQIGISRGTMRTGAYGGTTRLTYGVIGDDVNLAARLMAQAEPGEILLSGHTHKGVASDFSFEPHPPLPFKGRAEPLPVFAVTSTRQRRAIRLQEPTYALPMIGREVELQTISDKLDAVLHGKAQVIGIVAEAGLGKSRLVAEVIRTARSKGFVGYGGACQSDGLHTPYLVWKAIWTAFFSVDPDLPLRRQIRWLEGEIEDRVPTRIQALPLLSPILELAIPENEFTRTLEPQFRQSALHALVEDCLKAATQEAPHLIVLEDLHWIDALSQNLVDELAKALTGFPICFVLAYRPPELLRLHEPRLEALPHFTRIELHELNQAECEQAIRAKLAQLYPARTGAVPPKLVKNLMSKAQGNPFFLEELLNYLRDRGLDPRDPMDLQKIDLPDSLHALILSRIDQLNEKEKTTLRVASVIGRLFRTQWLIGYYPELGPLTEVKTYLDELHSLDITSLDSSEPELVYLFKHIVTHEVTYESLPFATRARLHEQLARYLESIGGASHDSPLLDTLAHHYGRSENVEKQREYLRKAGEAAQKNYANYAALEYYGQLLHLLKDAKEQTQIHLKRGEVYEFVGKYDEAESDYRAALETTKEDAAMKASAQYALGKLNRLRGDYAPALDWLTQAKEARMNLEDTAGLALVLIEIGQVLIRKGEYSKAHKALNEGLALVRGPGNELNTALALNCLGHVAHRQGDYPTAKALYSESLALSREMGDKQRTAALLDNLGVMAMDQGDYPAARAYHEESLALRREMGHKGGIAASLNNPGNVAMAQGDYLAARALYEESLALLREMGDKWGIAITLNNLGAVAMAQGDYVAARALQEENLAMSHEMNDKTGIAYALLNLGLVELVERKPEARGHILNSLRLRQEMGEQQTLPSSLIGAAGLALHEGKPHFGAQLLGAVDFALSALKANVEPELKLFHAQTLAKVQDVLSEAVFQSAWNEGVRWPLEEAVKRALDNDVKYSI